MRDGTEKRGEREEMETKGLIWHNGEGGGIGMKNENKKREEKYLENHLALSQSPAGIGGISNNVNTVGEKANFPKTTKMFGMHRGVGGGFVRGYNPDNSPGA